MSFKDMLVGAKEAFDTVAGLAGLAAWVKSLKPVAMLAAENLTPELAAKFKHRQQRNADGPVDEINFTATKLKLDGEDPNLAYRPLADNIDYFLAYLEYMDPDLRRIFVDFVGRLADSEEWRTSYLTRIALVTDEQRSEKTIRANFLRFEMAFNDGILRKPESELKKLMERHGHILLSAKDIASRKVESLKNIAIDSRDSLVAAEQHYLADDTAAGRATTGYRERARQRFGR